MDSEDKNFALGNNQTDEKPSLSSECASSKEEELECAVCLQTCIHPVQLPCSHIFCFLCVKGVANQSKRCAMCRQEIPADFLDHPTLLKNEECKEEVDEYQWFYGGRNGWWQYDERTSRELESSYNSGQRSCEILVAGFLYSIDFDKMMQQRRNDPSRRRRIKRDLSSIPKKGVAGIKTFLARNNSEVESQNDSQGINSSQSESDCSVGTNDGVQVSQVSSTLESLPEQSSNDLEISELEEVQILHSHSYRTNDNDINHQNHTSSNNRQGHYSTFNSLPTLYDVEEILEEEYETEQPTENVEVQDLSTHLSTFRLDQELQFYSLDDAEELDFPE